MRIIFLVFYDPADLGCRQLAAYMQQQGHDVRIIALKHVILLRTEKFSLGDSTQAKTCCAVHTGRARYEGQHIFEPEKLIQDSELQQLADAIKDWNPNIIGFGTRSKNLNLLPKVIPVLRKAAPKAFLVAGGAGPTLSPDIPLLHGVDAVIRGEGEYALLELVEAMQNGKDWRQVHNLVYQDAYAIKYTPLLPLEKSLTNFPLPFFDESNIILIDDAVKDKKQVSVLAACNNVYTTLSSRGCIADCSYCGGRSLRGLYQKEGLHAPKLRRRSLASVLEELRQVKQKANLSLIDIHDEYFSHPADEMIDFFNAYGREISLPFTAFFLTEQLAKHPEIIKSAVRAGLAIFSIGLQSGDEKFCKDIYNRMNNNKIILDVIGAFHELGLSGFLFTILGNPLESLESFEKTLEFSRQLPAFDFSLKKRIFFWTTKFFMPQGDVLIKKTHPQLLSMTYPPEKFFYYGMMLEFRHLLDDDAFTSVYNDQAFMKEPFLLEKYYHDILQQKHLEYWQKEHERLKSKTVYVFGGGQAYGFVKPLLAGLSIRAFINDFPGVPDTIDGIPVMPPQKAFGNGEVLPVVIVAKEKNANQLCMKLRRHYPQITDITCCLHIE